MTAEEVKHANVGTGTKKLWSMVYGPATFGAKAKADKPPPSGKILKKIGMPPMPTRTIV
jgi:hypothetical protein